MALLSHNERAQFDSFLSTFGGSSTTGLPPTLSPPSLGRRSATSTGTDTEGGSAMDHDGFRGTSGDGERGGKDDDEDYQMLPPPSSSIPPPPPFPGPSHPFPSANPAANDSSDSAPPSTGHPHQSVSPYPSYSYTHAFAPPPPAPSAHPSIPSPQPRPTNWHSKKRARPAAEAPPSSSSEPSRETSFGSAPKPSGLISKEGGERGLVDPSRPQALSSSSSTSSNRHRLSPPTVTPHQDRSYVDYTSSQTNASSSSSSSASSSQTQTQTRPLPPPSTRRQAAASRAKVASSSSSYPSLDVPTSAPLPPPPSPPPPLNTKRTSKPAPASKPRPPPPSNTKTKPSQPLPPPAPPPPAAAPGGPLTKEQKKLNHIASEHKRRAKIKTAYDLLCGEIPELKALAGAGGEEEEDEGKGKGKGKAKGGGRGKKAAVDEGGGKGESFMLQTTIAHIKDSITTRVHLLDRLAALRAERGLFPDGGNSRNALYEGEWGGEIEVGEGEEVEED